MPPIYVTKNGQQHGPYTLEELDQQLQAEAFTGDDLYWHEGADGWRPISQLPGYVAPPSSTAPAAAIPALPPAAPASQRPAASKSSGLAEYRTMMASAPSQSAASNTDVDATRVKENYVKRIRSTSTYPTFRALVGIVVMLIYVGGVIVIIGGLIAGIVAIGKEEQGIAGVGLILGGLIAGLIYIIIGKVLKETSLMVADIADSLLDLHSRYDQPK